jgi:hypothetical protein
MIGTPESANHQKNIFKPDSYGDGFRYELHKKPA